MLQARSSVIAPMLLGILRIVTALVFMQHGLQKLIGFPNAGHHPGPFVLLSLPGLAGILETFGGFAVLVGLKTRTVAFILSGQMAVAYWLIHFVAGLAQPRGWLPVVNGGDAAVLFCFIFLYLAAAGPGRLSLDGWLAARANPRV